MNILMTGATGLIGQELGLELFKRGHKIFVVSRDRKKALLQLPFPCEVIVGDLGSKLLPPESLNEIQGVIHLLGEGIAEKRWSSAQKTKIFESRVLGTRNLVHSFANKNLEVFISASATGIYGDRNDELLDEASAPGNDFLAEVCKGWEKEADEILESKKCRRLVKFRLGPVLSSSGGAMEKMRPAFQAGLGGRLGSGQQWMPWIHIKDVVSAFAQAIDVATMSGVYNLAAPEAHTNESFSQTVCQVLNRSMGPPVPAFALKLLLGQMSEVLLGSQKVNPAALQAISFKFQFPTLHAALMDVLKYQHQGEEVFEARQYFPMKIDQVFRFFADAKNLERITPPHLKFHIVHVSTEQIEKGTIIDYQLKIQGVPVKWKTLIEQWDPPYLFVDQALKGPYQFWYHTHSFEKLGEGTLMKDQVRFILPLGRIGWMAAFKKVTSDIKMIFDYRRKTVMDLLDFKQLKK